MLKLEGDERLVALIRAGNDRAFEVMFDRYQSRLLAFCTSMLKSRQDAEDVLQEVFANAHKAMLADERKINLRPWLYRIARNRCLNHLRKPVPEGQDSMDIHPHQHGTTTAEHAGHREDLRQLLEDVRHLPETQRTALLLREIEQLSYDEIAVAMDTTIPSIKSLLVRARIGLAESSQARALTCDEVRVQLAEAVEGLRKATGPIRKHVRNCEDCKEFRTRLRTDSKAMAALLPIGPLALLKGGLWAKLFGGGGSATGGATATGGGAAGSGAAAAGSGAVAAGGSAGGVIAGGSAAAGAVGGAAGVSGAAAGGVGLAGGALGAKAAAGMATAALLTGAAVEVSDGPPPAPTPPPAIERSEIIKGSKAPAKRDRRVVATVGSGTPVISEVDADAVVEPAPSRESPIEAAATDAEGPAPDPKPAREGETKAEADAPAPAEKPNPATDHGPTKREVPAEEAPTEGELTSEDDTLTPKVGPSEPATGGTAPSAPVAPKSSEAPPSGGNSHHPGPADSRTTPASQPRG